MQENFGKRKLAKGRSLTKLKKPCNLQCTTQSWVTQKEIIRIGGGQNEYIKDPSKDCGGSIKKDYFQKKVFVTKPKPSKA
jgi:hypothetical protein